MTLNSEGLEKAKEAIARSYVTYPDGSARTHISDWFDLDAQDAVDFGVMTEPKWHGHSDVRSDQQNAYIATVLGSGPLQVAISAYLSATPVDGLEVVAWEVQFQGSPLISNLSAVAEQYREDGKPVEELVRLSQASSVIAGLTAERDEAADRAKVWEHYWSQEVKVKSEVVSWAKEAMDKVDAAEARISSLEEQNKRLREALNQARLAFSGHVSTGSAIDMIDTLEDHNG